MSTTTTSISNVLNSLIETCKDGQEGYRSAAEHVKNADFKSLFSTFSTQRQQFAGELQKLVTNLGEEAEKSGTTGGSVHRVWIDLKSAITNDDEHAILAECERGEDAAVAEYREALDHVDLPNDVRSVVERQSVAVKSSHDRVRDLRDQLHK